MSSYRDATVAPSAPRGIRTGAQAASDSYGPRAACRRAASGELVAVIGIVVGTALAALATVALSTWNLTFTIPVSTLAATLAIAFLAGRAAARAPVRRAARLDPLRALQYE